MKMTMVNSGLKGLKDIFADIATATRTSTAQCQWKIERIHGCQRMLQFNWPGFRFRSLIKWAQHVTNDCTVSQFTMVRARRRGFHFHTWEYWGCAAGQGVFLSFRNWDRVLFWASNSGHPLSMYFADFSGYYQPNFITFFNLIASKCYKQKLKSLNRPWNMKYIGSNYTISRSIKFSVNLQIGTGCLFIREANWDRVRFWTCPFLKRVPIFRHLKLEIALAIPASND